MIQSNTDQGVNIDGSGSSWSCYFSAASFTRVWSKCHGISDRNDMVVTSLPLRGLQPCVRVVTSVSQSAKQVVTTRK